MNPPNRPPTPGQPDRAGKPGGAGEPGNPARGCIVWLTGLPCAGKSTLARRLSEILGASRAVEVLDGDVVRKELSPDLGFSRADRDLNIRRVAFLARCLARHGVLVIVAVVSPYAGARGEAKARAAEEGIPFLEVFVTAPLETLVARDVKGMYRKAIAGEINAFTGVSDPYEPPADPDVTLRTDTEPLEASVDRVVAALEHRHLV